MPFLQTLLRCFGSARTEERNAADDHIPTWFWPPEGRSSRRRRGHLAYRAQAYQDQQSCILRPPHVPKRTWHMARVRTFFVTSSSTSKLLALPAEVRIMIWCYVTGGRRIAIFRDNRRLTHCILDGSNSQTPGVMFNVGPSSVLSVVRNIRGDFDEPPRPRRSSTLALMKTCRKVYYESINLLYSENTFVLLQNHALVDLYTTLLPDHFAAIRSFHIHWQVRAPLRGCTRTWYETSHEDFNKALRPLNTRQAVQHLSVFIQGAMHGSKSYCTILNILGNYRNMTTSSFAVRLPRPTYDQERQEMDREIYDSGLHVVQPPWKAHGEMADDDTGYDVGWRVGTLFSIPMNGSLEPEATSYAIFAPIPKQCLRQPRKERRNRRPRW